MEGGEHLGHPAKLELPMIYYWESKPTCNDNSLTFRAVLREGIERSLLLDSKGYYCEDDRQYYSCKAPYGMLNKPVDNLHYSAPAHVPPTRGSDLQSVVVLESA